jgi:hypothetical protein
MIFYRLMHPSRFIGEQGHEYFATKKEAVDFCIQNEYPTDERDIKKCSITLKKRDLIHQFNLCAILS